MNLDLSTLSDVTDRPATGTHPSTVRAQLVEASRMHRRSVWKLTLGTAVASSMTAVGVVGTPRRAYAADPYTTWQHCQAYNSVDPEGDWKWCNPNGSSSGRIGSSFCDGGWHRSDTVASNNCNKTQYTVAYRCDGDDGTVKNAWEWHISDDPSTPNPENMRCSDGKRQYMIDCVWQTALNSTCKKPLAS